MIWLLLACTPELPDQEPALRRSIQSYDQGVELLQHGDAEGASQAFAQASALDPGSAELLVWQAKAQAQIGDLTSAISLLDRAVSLSPGMVEAWYNRACYKARAGDLQRAAQDLGQALRSPELDPLLVAQDPDLQVLRGHPEYGAVLPRAELPLRLELPQQAAFLGQEIEAVVTLERGQSFELSYLGAATPTLRPTTLIQETLGQGLSLRVRMEVLGAGEPTLGPWRFSSGGISQQLEGGALKLLAPSSHQSPAQIWTGPWWVLPAELLSKDAGAQRLQDGWVVVSAQAGDRILWQAQEVVRLEVREQGVLLAYGQLGQLPPGQEVRIMRGQREVWSGSP